MSNNDLAKSKIININDFIFRQNLEFYPNLKGITCVDNILTYQENGTVLAEETLTFDLRTLPGQVWNYDCKKFMEVIRFNKDCLTLGDVADFISEQPLNIAFPNNIESGDIA